LAALGDLPGLAARLSRDLDAAGIPHAISGAVAMAAHGYVRATSDLDVLVATPAIRWPLVFDIVRAHGFTGEDRDLIASLRERYFATLRSGPVTVDLLVPALPWHREIIERALRRETGGGSVPFVTIEDLIVLKCLWRRAKDIPDLHALIAAAPSLDERYVRETLRRLLPAADPRHAELDDLLRRYRPGPGTTP
jgi:hypothetical protein